VESLPSKKKDPQKKERRELGLKGKRGETSYEELHVQKKERLKFTSCWERFYENKERRSHFLIVQNLTCGIIHTHTSFVLPSIP
jgi:hypothetical protein